MNFDNKPFDRIVHELRERAKELSCLYQVQEILRVPDATVEQVCKGIIAAIPPGWQYPEVCVARIELNGQEFYSIEFEETIWGQHQEILVQDHVVGRLSVYYLEERSEEDEGPFLKEERKLIQSIADQLSDYLLHQRLKKVFEQQGSEQERKAEWWVILDLLRRTDPALLLRISKKMVNFLIREGVEEARAMLEYFSPAYQHEREILEVNQPFQLDRNNETSSFIEDVFILADSHLSENSILEHIQQWVKEDQSNFLTHALAHPSSSLDQIDSAITRFHHLSERDLELSQPREKSARTALVRRLLCDQPQFINTAEGYLPVDLYFDLFKRLIYPVGSHGKVGGKSAGLLLADQILQMAAKDKPLLQAIKTPKTWYITSDALFEFLGYNGIEDVIEHKYRDLDQIRQEYPYIVNLFKSSPLPPEIVKGLQVALDDFGDVPLIVRSSSLLEDRTGMAFAGKYKSLFISNQGSKEERLNALADAIGEVYASMFAIDPIEYRIEHGMLDQHEEMGVLIQEVVGSKVGPYYLPAFAGVAFSSNQFPWSSRITPEDGLARLVPGLGTRAVDRVSNDYPTLVAPGKPGMRIYISPEEILRYSPKHVDAINLETRSLETIEFSALVKKHWRDYPMLNKIVSVVSGYHIQHPVGLGVDYEKDAIAVTFENLFSRTSFLKQITAILTELEFRLGYPVDIEFAHDGQDFYLLQCRSQNFSTVPIPSEISFDVPTADILFSSRQYGVNGFVEGISYLVYVDPKKYAELSKHQDLMDVGSAVGKLNSVLPRRNFILIGPGRWGSRGDIKLGVQVTYADIRNTAMLIEVPIPGYSAGLEPSFGTHFFQDLMEASIRYLPLDTNQKDTVLNLDFIMKANNSLPSLAPDWAKFEGLIHVIDIPEVTGGKRLNIYMNSNQNQTLAVLSDGEDKKGGEISN